MSVAKTDHSGEGSRFAALRAVNTRSGAAPSESKGGMGSGKGPKQNAAGEHGPMSKF